MNEHILSITNRGMFILSALMMITGASLFVLQQKRARANKDVEQRLSKQKAEIDGLLAKLAVEDSRIEEANKTIVSARKSLNVSFTTSVPINPKPGPYGWH